MASVAPPAMSSGSRTMSSAGGHSHARASTHGGAVGRSRSWPSEAVTRPREELGTDGVTSGKAVAVSNDSHDAR